MPRPATPSQLPTPHYGIRQGSDAATLHPWQTTRTHYWTNAETSRTGTSCPMTTHGLAQTQPTLPTFLSLYLHRTTTVVPRLLLFLYVIIGNSHYSPNYPLFNSLSHCLICLSLCTGRFDIQIRIVVPQIFRSLYFLAVFYMLLLQLFYCPGTSSWPTQLPFYATIADLGWLAWLAVCQPTHAAADSWSHRLPVTSSLP